MPLAITDRFSLTLSMVLLTVAVGTGVWLITDRYQVKNLDREITENLKQHFVEQAREQRIRFDQYVKSYGPAVKLYAGNIAVKRYLDEVDWRRPAGEPVSHEQLPPWLPSLSSMRQFVMPRYALLIDDDGNTREIYRYRYEPPHERLIDISPLALELSIDQTYLIMFDDELYLIASERVQGLDQGRTAVLLIASPIDQQFLYDSQGAFLGENIISLLRDDEDSIFISSDPQRVMVGTRLDDLRQQYMVTGEGFFDSGSAEIIIRFFSLTSMHTVHEQVSELIEADRNVRMLTAVSFILAFSAIMYWIAARIRRLGKRVERFSARMSLPIPDISYKDELLELDNRFRLLADAIHSEKQSLVYQASHDSLTGLPNRKDFNAMLQAAISQGQRGSDRFVLMMCDLDRFKQVNDTYGHQAGDVLIQQAGERLRTSLRDIDYVARLGGDEFAILVMGLGIDEIEVVSRKIVESFSRPFEVDGHSLDVGISIGAAFYPQPDTGADKLMRQADAAMYHAKRSRDCFAVYEHDDDAGDMVGQTAADHD